ncbi:hypothetical protein [Methylobacterium sp. WL8]|uniref:hypothetical protein n=1 Tax=Methylobacterium sp. WL8 TaxID=2603899 RepID=UPI00164F031C|nr:hypothetical protein [Methylobacterium sp. WL8]
MSATPTNAVRQDVKALVSSAEPLCLAIIFLRLTIMKGAIRPIRCTIAQPEGAQISIEEPRKH